MVSCEGWCTDIIGCHVGNAVVPHVPDDAASGAHMIDAPIRLTIPMNSRRPDDHLT